MIAAKDYYYTVLAPEERGRNYQQVHQSHLFTDSCEVFSHKPRLSNDILIEGYVDELKLQTSPEISNSLEEFFVAKRRNYFANAGALHRKEEYRGNIVFFYVGLSDLLFQYAILFTDFFRLIREREKRDGKSPQVMYWFNRVLSNASKLRNAQIDWGISRNEIRFKEQTLVVPHPEEQGYSVTVATLMDKAVLRHEIAHHLLGHTSPQKDAFSLGKFVLPYLENLEHPPEHRRELEADLASIYLPAGSGKLIEDEQGSFEVSLGTALCQTVLSHLKCSIHLDSTSHPSWNARHQLSVQAMRDLYHPEGCDAALSMASRFQAFLYLTQGRGLGELTINDWISGRTSEGCA